MSNSAAKRAAHVPPRTSDADVFGLAEELSQLSKAQGRVSGYVERQLGLNQRQLRLLAQVGEAPLLPELAGEDDELDVLRRRDLITPDGDQVTITEQGKVVLDQVEAIRIRIADRLVTDLGPEETQMLRTVVQQLIATASGQPRSGQPSPRLGAG